MRPLLLTLALSLLSLGCDGNEPQDETGPCTGTGRVTATIDGAPFSSTCVNGVHQPGNLILVALESADPESLTILISVTFPTVGQPFSLPYNAAQVRYAGVSDDPAERATSVNGTLTLTTLSDTGASGTFSFDAIIGGRTVRVRDGEISVML